ELAESVAEEMAQFDGENLPGAHVVAVGEPAGGDEDLVALELPRILAEAVDVDALGDGPHLLEGELRLGVAVGAGGSQDQDARSSHSRRLPKGTGAQPLAGEPEEGRFCLTSASRAIIIVIVRGERPHR